jgi:hypothetical protein
MASILLHGMKVQSDTQRNLSIRSHEPKLVSSNPPTRNHPNGCSFGKTELTSLLQ